MKFSRKLLNSFKTPSGSGDNQARSDRKNDKSEDALNAGEGVADPPPAYESHGTRAESTPYSKEQGLVASTAEDPYAFLSSFETVFLIDDSRSMRGGSWREVQLALRDITPICVAHDADGIDLYFLNHQTGEEGDANQGKASSGFYKIRKSKTVEEIFDEVHPQGATFTGRRLHHILQPYLRLLERNKRDFKSVNPLNIIVITDGAPCDDVEAPIITAAKKLDKLDAPPHQLGIQFFQVGSDAGAKEALRQLDDGLKDVRDIVDTVTWKDGEPGKLDSDQILKALLGAVIKRLDRIPARGEGSH
ncbi:hypothetical protein CGGC5_v005890 [Colletotrichum fructicola Nara gc5]|uniref:VWFA domain-containing protein n=2 Tax=Colletotrichum fructicola (strain Nara gc5) TaxID=1213859 RepID=A0A7J6JBL9_COLFN|nr:hypothetical protein CGGC5_v005890 [Colletotrichum fructicola Nara gc5]KAF4879485.1 hypothetical protein CGCFRS4_v016098 [Colletotrichum fructicola]